MSYYRRPNTLQGFSATIPSSFHASLAGDDLVSYIGESRSSFIAASSLTDCLEPQSPMALSPRSKGSVRSLTKDRTKLPEGQCEALMIRHVNYYYPKQMSPIRLHLFVTQLGPFACFIASSALTALVPML